MKNARLLLLLVIALLLSTAGCKVNVATSGTTTQATTKAGATTKGTPLSGSAVFTNKLLAQGMNASAIYTRTSKVTTSSGSSKAFVVTNGFAYVRSPLARQLILDTGVGSAYNEDIIIKDTLYNRTEKTGKWQKYGPGDWSAEEPFAYQYDLKVIEYPINYDKLTFTKVSPVRLLPKPLFR